MTTVLDPKPIGSFEKLLMSEVFQQDLWKKECLQRRSGWMVRAVDKQMSWRGQVAPRA